MTSSRAHVNIARWSNKNIFLDFRCFNIFFFNEKFHAEPNLDDICKDSVVNYFYVKITGDAPFRI